MLYQVLYNQWWTGSSESEVAAKVAAASGVDAQSILPTVRPVAPQELEQHSFDMDGEVVTFAEALPLIDTRVPCLFALKIWNERD